jgi:hypothetical protein
MADSNIKRVNMRMGQDLHDWFEKKADELGVPTSALMIIAMNEYRKLQTGADNLPMLNEIYRLMQVETVQSSVSEAVLDVERPGVIA